LLVTRAFGITKEELVQRLKDGECLGTLLRGICDAVKVGYVGARKGYSKAG